MKATLSGMTTRPMTAEDTDAVVWLEGVALGSGQSREVWRKLLEEPTTLARVAVDDRGRVVGFIACLRAADELGINHLAVLPEARRQGVGTRLIKRVIREARAGGVRRIFLEVRKRNRGAQQMYRHFGFKEVGRRSGYYKAPIDDALIYCLHLTPE